MPSRNHRRQRSLKGFFWKAGRPETSEHSVPKPLEIPSGLPATHASRTAKSPTPRPPAQKGQGRTKSESKRDMAQLYRFRRGRWSGIRAGRAVAERACAWILHRDGEPSAGARELVPVAAPVPGRDRGHLRGRLRLAPGAGPGAVRGARDHAAGRAHDGLGRAPARLGTPAAPDAPLVRRERRAARTPLLARPRARAVRACGLRGATGAPRVLDALSLARVRRLAVPELPVGRAAARGGPARDRVGAGRPAPREGRARAGAHVALARLLAALPADGALGRGQARQRGRI